jgi:two-component system, cell cycle sensor histidine kinase and response regulator CckA
MKILIVDDDFTNLSILTTLLEKKGYEVVTAFNGEEALHKLRSNAFDLILSDVLMPVMDGYKLSQLCKKDETLKHIPIIICTGTYIDETDEQIALKFGAEAYLKKPFDQKTLFQTIENVLANVKSGKVSTLHPEPPEKNGIYKLYSERLVNKLEKKMQELDKEKMALEMEVAERIKIEDRLRKSRDYAESLFKNAPGIVLIMDTEGRILRLNPFMEKISGYKLEEVQGKNWNEIFSPENGSKSIVDLSKGANENQVPLGNLSTIMTKDGIRRDIIWYDRPLKDNDGKTIGLLAIGQDISEQLTLQRNLFRSKKFEAIGSFAGGIAHDFNSLLTLILGNISLAEENVEPGSEASECLGEARDASLCAKEMASRLMLFSKGRDPVKISSHIHSIVWDAVNSAIRVFKIQCEFDIPENLYPVDIDPWLMKHALHNVTLNAVEAMKGRGHIFVKCENVEIKDRENLNIPPGRYVKISIKDRGPGIAKENLSKIFDPDFSTKNTGVIKGLGLGLSVVFSIIEKHDGMLNVASEPGAGTTVSIYLPASTVTSPVPPNQYEADLPLKLTGRGEKILILDDEEPLRRMFEKMIARLGYDPVSASTGDETVKIFRKAAGSVDPVEAVLIDMTHKFSIRGEETIQKLREINPDIPIIICTGHPNDPIVADFKSHGFSGVLIKPFTKNELGLLMAGILLENG